MISAPCYVMSDAHIGFAPGEVEGAVISFLRYLETTRASLVINGDLFEFWFEWKTVIPRRGFRTVAALADLVDSGVSVTFVAGNHDCWGGDILRNDVGVDYVFGPVVTKIGGWNAHIEHGDGLRPKEDTRYRMVRGLLRNRAAIRAFRWLHPDLSTPVATGSSGASRSYSAKDGGRGLREAAQRTAIEHQDVDLVVFGHSHVATLEQLPNGAIYGNPGSWLDGPTFLRVTENRVALRRWDGSAESADLNAFDRRAQKTLAKP